MPKIKTRSAAAKRIRVTGSGKIVHRKAMGAHLLTKKSSRRKRRLSRQAEISSCNRSAVKRVIPNSF